MYWRSGKTNPLPFDPLHFVPDDCDAWTLNASLTRSSSCRKCSKRRILGHSAQATSLLPIEGTTKCSHTARGLGFGGGMAYAAARKLMNSDWANLKDNAKKPRAAGQSRPDWIWLPVSALRRCESRNCFAFCKFSASNFPTLVRMNAWSLESV